MELSHKETDFKKSEQIILHEKNYLAYKREMYQIMYCNY